MPKPKKNGVYVGTIKSVFDLAVTLKVSKTGKSARIAWACGTGRGSTSFPNVPIDSTSHFKASGNSGESRWTLRLRDRSTHLDQRHRVRGLERHDHADAQVAATAVVASASNASRHRGGSVGPAW